MATRKVLAVLALAAFWSLAAANRATAQEPARDSKKADKDKKAEAPPAPKAEEGKGKGHEGQAKEKDKCDPPKLTTKDNKTGYACEASKTCDKNCNLWRSDKETNAAEFMAKQGEWKEATDAQRRRYRYWCKCEEAK